MPAAVDIDPLAPGGSCAGAVRNYQTGSGQIGEDEGLVDATGEEKKEEGRDWNKAGYLETPEKGLVSVGQVVYPSERHR